jgi:hypothetical protein
MFRAMTTTVDPEQLRWFRSWVELCDAEPPPTDNAVHYLPPGFARVLVVRHPGTEVVAENRDGTPFRGDPSTEGHPSAEQKRRLEQLLMATSGEGAAATLAGYDPVPDDPEPLLAEATRVRTHIDYLLVGGVLAELTYTPWEARWPYERPVSVLWPNDRRWWLHSDPDSSFTVVGCDDELAERLLAEPVLRAVEWPGRERGDVHG